MAPLKELLNWTDRLTDVDPDRAQAAAETASKWPVPDLARRFGRPRDIDDVVRVVLLVEAIDALTERGVPENKLMAKLKDVRQFEATWAELYVVSVLATGSDEDVGVELEAGASHGAHADVRLLMPDGEASSFEIKAVGLSDRELAFCDRMAPSLEHMVPPYGVTTGHAPLEGEPPKLTAALLAQIRQGAMHQADITPYAMNGLSAAVIVAHEAEHAYARRAAARVVQAVRQLPVRESGWVALLWTNGSPVDQVMAAIDWSQVPGHVHGIVFIGLVMAFPRRDLDGFVQILGRDAPIASPDERRVTESALNLDLAESVLRRTEASSGVRATLIRGRIRGKRRGLLRRDGTQRIPPFSVLLDQDPAYATEGRRPQPPAQ